MLIARRGVNTFIFKKKAILLVPWQSSYAGGCIYVTLYEKENPFIFPLPQKKK